jgi:hypothetical protein
MPAKDIYHDAVKQALQKDGWTITQDPYVLKLSKGKKLFIDLGAERLIAAERGLEKIAVEVKSFRRTSEMKDLEDAVGQFVLYDHLLSRYDPERKLYLAAPEAVRESIFEGEAGAVLIEDRVIRLFTFDPFQEAIVQWIL